MDKYSGKYRTTLCAGQSQEQVRKKIGTPIETYYAGSKNKHTYDRMPKYSYDAFRVIGKIQKPLDDCSLAMMSGVTFGTSEVLAIPMITFFIARDSVKTRTLVVYYDKSLKYRTHDLYDSKGRWISPFDY